MAPIDYTLDLFTETVYEALVKHGITKATLIGNSLGGGIAIQMALDHPDYIHRLFLMTPGCIEGQRRLGRLKMPVLVFWGAAERFMPLIAWAISSSNATTPA